MFYHILLQELLCELVDTTVCACASCIQSCIAQRSFAEHFPRLAILSAVNPRWEEGDQVISAALVRVIDLCLHIQSAKIPFVRMLYLL